MNKVFFIIFCITILSCNKTSFPDSLEVVRNIEATHASLTELISSIEVVCLQHGDSILIDDKGRLLQRDSSYYLIDRFGTKETYRFGLNGKFYSKIGTQGDGPGEYNNILDMFIEEKKDEVYVESYPFFILYRYTKTGVFKDKKEVKIPVSGFHKFNDHYWAFAGYANYPLPQYLIKLDTSLCVTDSIALPANPIYTKISFFSHFSSLKDTAYFWQNPYPIIYKLDNDTIQQILFFDFGDKFITYNDIYDTNKKDIRNKKNVIIQNYSESNTHILVELITLEKKDSFRILYGLKNKTTKQWNWIEPKVTNNSNIPPDWYFDRTQGFAQDGRLMCFFFGNEIEELTEEARKLITNPQELENIDPEMDMFVLLCRFK